ncbi:MAG: hypothetical protein ACI91O_000917 [Candidatus Poriferisodalaceae bacterium]
MGGAISCVSVGGVESQDPYALQNRLNLVHCSIGDLGETDSVLGVVDGLAGSVDFGEERLRFNHS